MSAVLETPAVELTEAQFAAHRSTPIMELKATISLLKERLTHCKKYGNSPEFLLPEIIHACLLGTNNDQAKDLIRECGDAVDVVLSEVYMIDDAIDNSDRLKERAAAARGGMGGAYMHPGGEEAERMARPIPCPPPHIGIAWGWAFLGVLVLLVLLSAAAGALALVAA